MVQIIIKKARSGNRPALKLMKVYPNEQYLDAIPSFAELDGLVDTMLIEAGEHDTHDYDLLLDGVPLTNANTIKRLSALGANAHVVLKLCPSSSTPSPCPSTRTPSPRRSQGGASYSPESSDPDDDLVSTATTGQISISTGDPTEQTTLASVEALATEDFAMMETLEIRDKVKRLFNEFTLLKDAINGMIPEEYEVVARGMLMRTKQVYDAVVEMVSKTNPTLRRMKLALESVGHIIATDTSLKTSEDGVSLAMTNAAYNIVSNLRAHAHSMKDVCKYAKKMEAILDEILFFNDNDHLWKTNDVFESAKYVMSLRRGLSEHMVCITDICLKTMSLPADTAGRQDEIEEPKKLEDRHSEDSASIALRLPIEDDEQEILSIEDGSVAPVVDDSAGPVADVAVEEVAGDTAEQVADSSVVPVTDDSAATATKDTAAGRPRVIRITLPWAKSPWAVGAEINMAIGAKHTVGDVRFRLAQIFKRDRDKVKVIATMKEALPWVSTEDVKTVVKVPLNVTLKDHEPVPNNVIIRGLDSKLLHYIKWHPYGAILMQDQAVAMQQELYECFSAPHFREGLSKVRETVGGHSPRFNARLLMAICFNEQKKVLPKYGFEATLDAVQTMQTTIRELFDDEDVGATLMERNRQIQALLRV